MGKVGVPTWSSLTDMSQISVFARRSLQWEELRYNVDETLIYQTREIKKAQIVSVHQSVSVVGKTWDIIMLKLKSASNELAMRNFLGNLAVFEMFVELPFWEIYETGDVLLQRIDKFILGVSVMFISVPNTTNLYQVGTLSIQVNCSCATNITVDESLTSQC